jgi:general secretion pathway protein M
MSGNVNILSSRLQPLQHWWNERPAREKPMLIGAAVLIGIALLWWIGIAPALRTLSGFETKWAAQDAQLQAMLQLQTQAQALKAGPKITTTAAAQTLQTSVIQSFGGQAEIAIQSQTATLTLRGVSGEALAQWLATARTNARSVPVQAKLVRAANGWTGTLQLGLPNS